jgi:hypothetical protein
MSPERKEYYNAKQRRMAFYIVENDIKNKESPPTVSAIIGLDKKLQAPFLAARRPLAEKKQIKLPIKNKNGLLFPSMPKQWKNNLSIIIPKAEFGYFYPIRSMKY